MLSDLMGPIGGNAACVFVSFFIAFGVIVAARIIARQSQREIENKFSLETIKLENEKTVKLAQIAADRGDRNSKSDRLVQALQNVIASHEEA